MSVRIRKRPLIISILAVAGFIASAFQIIAISAPSIRDVAIWYPILYGSIISLRFISLVGVWHMKKWGAELFLYSTLAKLIVQIGVGDFGFWTGIGAFFAVVYALVFLSFYKRMGRDL
jgi:hypothetical protein